MEKSNFFAFLSRMKYINRWGLMRNIKDENVSEHSLEVAIIAHALAVIQQKRLNIDINPERAALYALFHDSSEIFTGDLPTPVKYFNPTIKTAYKDVEQHASKRLLNLLPKDLHEVYEPILMPNEEEAHIWKTIKAADKITAYIKCIEEEKSGNKEFIQAKQTIFNEIKNLNRRDVNIFIEQFMEGYYLTLDEMEQ
ncbi:MAG: 5'-deoxynucleotidase [Tissierellia bacterium]|nr:5'-deoxynucleotidase [Tissierellia bacterium]MDD4779868.1 5'-deoxynucleotidase [Tissierellia bacterium]